MGMYDTLYCKVPLPGDHPFDSTTEFQTKDLDCLLQKYVIEEDGRLMGRTGYYESVPEEERPYPDASGIKALIGSLRFVDTGWEAVDAHQRIHFYTFADGKWFDFVATYTHGALEGIELATVGKYEQLRKDSAPCTPGQ